MTKIINGDFNSLNYDLDKITDVIFNSDNLEELLAAFVVLVSFSYDIKNNELLSSVREKLSESTHTMMDKWNEIHRFEKKKKITANKEITSQINMDTYINQRNILDEFFSKYSIDLEPYTKLSDYEIYIILKTFYESNRDDISLDILDTLVNSGRIFSNTMSKALGGSIFSVSLDKQYIRLSNEGNFLELIALAHEIAHIKYFILTLRKTSFEENNDFFYKKQYIEAYPVYAERKLIDYLIQENLLKRDIKKYLLLELNTQRNKLYEFTTQPLLSKLRYVNGQIGGELLRESEVTQLILKANTCESCVV